jgi:hypothetical protein
LPQIWWQIFTHCQKIYQLLLLLHNLSLNHQC